MRKVISQLALAAAALAGVSTSANAYVVLALNDPGVPGSAVSCDTSMAVSATNCGTGFTVVNLEGVTFSGTVGNFSVFTTSFSGDIPGGPQIATLDASTTRLKYNGAGTGTFTIDLTGYDYLNPVGPVKLFSGSASQSSSVFALGDQIASNFYVDGSNSGLLTNGVSCVLAINSNSSCNSGAPIAWADGAPAQYSIRDIQVFTMNSGSTTNSTSTAIVAKIPEPVSTALVGISLLALGLTSRRRFVRKS
jgi:hypothetical protein